MTDTPIEAGQVYRPCKGGPKVRIVSYAPGVARAAVVDDLTNERLTPVLVRHLHATPLTDTGQRRRSGYVLYKRPDRDCEPAVTDTSQAALLREAADKLRALATAAAASRPAPWSVSCAATVTSPRPDGFDYVTGYTTRTGTAVAEHIAAMDPAVGEALADLLDDLADGDDGDDEGVINPWALAVARLLLGDS